MSSAMVAVNGARRPARRTEAERGREAAQKIGPRLRLKVLRLVEERVDASLAAEARIAASALAIARIERLEYEGEAGRGELLRQVMDAEQLAAARRLVLSNADIRWMMGECEDRWGQRRQGDNLFALSSVPPVLLYVEGGDGWPDAPAVAGDKLAIGNGAAHC